LIVTAVPGATSMKVVLDADHPLPVQPPTSTVPVAVRVGSGNMQGPYSTSDTSRLAQYTPAANLIESMGIDLFGATELHEEKSMHKLFLNNYLKPKNADWALAEGDGGNQLLYRPSLYTVAAKPMQLPYGRNVTDFTVTHKATGFQLHALVTHFFANDDDGTSRDKEREAAAKFIAQYAVGLKHVILMGDFNFQQATIAKLRGIIAGAGLVGLQTRTPGLPYGDKDSSSGSTSGRWIDDTFTRYEQSVTGAAGVLADNVGASDHYLWNRVEVGFVVESSDPPVRMSVWREDGEARVPLPGLQNIVAATTVATDHTVPLNRPVTYSVELSTGETVSAASAQIAAPLPLLTHPVTGRSAPVIIQAWPDRNTETPSSLVKVAGRRSPVVLSDVEALGTSSPVLMTRTRAVERILEELVATGDVLHLRTLYPQLPDAFLAITARQSSRVLEFKGDSPERLNTLSAQEIGAEDMREAGRGDTLADIAGAMPGATLADLSALFPGGTLLDIAVNDWRNAGLIPVLPPTPPSSNALLPSPTLYPSLTTYPGA
jgi:endonuclease/exonuclease/phosphatase family metal-dependent hydrolase